MKTVNEFRKKKCKKKKKSKRTRYDYVFYNGRLLKIKNFNKYEFNVKGTSAKFLGIHNVRMGNRPQRYNKPHILGTDFYHCNADIFNHFGIDVSDDCIVNGNFETNKHTIQEQMDRKNFDGTVLPKKKHFKIFKNIFKNVIRKLRIRTLQAPVKGDMNYVFFNKDTKPGFRYESYYKKQSKKDCRNIAQVVAGKRWDAIVERSRKGEMIKRDDISPSLYTIGARNKREEEPIDGELAKSRAVHMPEFHAELQCGAFSDRITEHFKEKGHGPIYIGNSIVRYERLEKDILKSICSVEGDWKKFDSTLMSFLLVGAISILRCYFRDGLDIDNHFLAIVDAIVLKDYVFPGGRVFRIISGLPSGSKLTNLLGSIINMIMLTFVFRSINSKKLSFAIGGDDFVVFIRKKIASVMELERLVKKECEFLGVNLKFFKFKSHDPNKFSSYPVFYKYTVFNGNPIVPIENVLERAFSPWNKDYSKGNEIMTFVWDIFGSLGPPNTSYLPLYLYMKNLYKRLLKIDVSLKTIVDYHNGISSNIFYLREFGYSIKYKKKEEFLQFVHVDEKIFDKHMKKVFFK